MKFRQCFVRMFFHLTSLIFWSHLVPYDWLYVLHFQIYYIRTGTHGTRKRYTMFVYSILLPLARHVRYYSLHEYKPKTTRGNLWVLRYLHQVWAASIASASAAADNSALEILHMLSILWPNTFQKANANAKSNWMRQSLRSFTFGSVRHLNKKDHTHLAGAALK